MFKSLLLKYLILSHSHQHIHSAELLLGKVRNIRIKLQSESFENKSQKVGSRPEQPSQHSQLPDQLIVMVMLGSYSSSLAFAFSLAF